MMYLHPEYVDTTKIELVKAQNPKFGKFPDVVTYYEFHDNTYNGILGDATLASPEKGKAIVEKCVNRIVEFMKFEFGC